MTLSEWSDLAQIVGAIAVVASLIFVGVQLRQNTMQLRRGASDSAMAQASAIRLVLLTHRDVAELVVSELKGGIEIDAADEVRLNALFGEITYLSMNAWLREPILNASNTLSRVIAPVAGPILRSRHGLLWWSRSRAQFDEKFVAAFEAAIPGLALAAEPVAPAEPTVAPSPPPEAQGAT